MVVENLLNLAALIKREREALLAEWRKQVRQLPSARDLDTPTLNDGVPVLLDELASALYFASTQTISETLRFLEAGQLLHGINRYRAGFDIVEVVSEYNILRGCIHDFANSQGVSLRGRAFHILNRFLNEAIASAVQAFSMQQALETQRRREEYLAFVAHDLNTPLTAISFATRFLEHALPEKDRSTETGRMLKTLRRNVQYLQVMVEHVLKESEHVRTDSGVKLERRVFDLWPLVESLTHELHPVADTAGTRLVNQVPEDLTAYADASLLKRVFQNLVANAIKYTPRGTVVIGARELEDGGLECWVRDDGTGIPEDRIGRVFDKLEADPDNPDGTGLGLAIVKAFVEAHGGTVSVASTEGVGSTFRFTIPARVKEVVADIGAQPPGEVAPLRNALRDGTDSYMRGGLRPGKAFGPPIEFHPSKS